MKKESLREEKGFTLIELLAVIVILAVLMVVAGTNVFGTMTQARRNSFRTEFLSLLSAAEQAASIQVVQGKLNNTNSCIYYFCSGSDTGTVACPTTDNPTVGTTTNGGGLDTYFDNKGHYGYFVTVKYANGGLTIKGGMASNSFLIGAAKGSAKYDITKLQDTTIQAASVEDGTTALIAIPATITCS